MSGVFISSLLHPLHDCHKRKMDRRTDKLWIVIKQMRVFGSFPYQQLGVALQPLLYLYSIEFQKFERCLFFFFFKIHSSIISDKASKLPLKINGKKWFFTLFCFYQTNNYLFQKITVKNIIDSNAKLWISYYKKVWLWSRQIILEKKMIMTILKNTTMNNDWTLYK